MSLILHKQRGANCPGELVFARADVDLFRLPRNETLIVFVAAISLFLFQTNAVCAQLDELQARELAKRAFMNSAPHPDCAEIKSRETELETSLNRCVQNAPGSSTFIFRVSDWGTEPIGDQKTIVHTGEHEFESLLAVMSDGKVFDPSYSIQSFNAWISMYKIVFSDVSDLNNCFDVYLGLNPEHVRPLPLKLESAAQLKDLAEKLFREDHASKYWERWWRRCGPLAAKLDFNLEVTRDTQGFFVGYHFSKEGFIIRYYSLSQIDSKHPQNGPSIYLESVEMSPQGQVGPLTGKIVHKGL